MTIDRRTCSAAVKAHAHRWSSFLVKNRPQVMSGAPFFTSVPSGRVGVSRPSTFRSNEHFREAVADRELHDVLELEARLGRK